MNERDIAIRTILGEAAGEGPQGWAAVAHVLRNRAADTRWPGTVGAVAKQPKQFSTWNTGAGGNHIPHTADPNSETYKKVGAVYDQVMAGEIPDPTGGATHYYSPAGMQALVSSGAQTNTVPGWFEQQTAMRGADPTTIGGHIFTGKANPLSFNLPSVAPQTTAQLAFRAPEQSQGGIWDTLAKVAKVQAKAQPYASYTPPPPANILPPEAGQYQARKRQPAQRYLDFLNSIGV